MRTLKTYLGNETIDGHIHLFDHQWNLLDKYDYTKGFGKVVGFADICLDNLQSYDGHKIIKYYDDFIHKTYNPKKHILLATADNPYDAISIYLKYPHIIKGFGEFKCYKVYRGNNVGYGNLNWIRPVCDFNKGLKLPIYIHWCFCNESDVREFESLITDYPNIPFVLCHCGMGFDISVDGDSMFAYNECVRLSRNHPNLYFDISYKAVDFFLKNADLINSLRSRSIVGSDINPQVYRVVTNPTYHRNKVYKKLRKVYDGCFYNPLNLFYNTTVDYKELTTSDYIISQYLKNIENLSTDSQQHFITRLNLIQPMDITNGINNVCKDVEDIIKLYKQSKYSEIVKRYVLPPYKSTGVGAKDKIGRWLESIKDLDLLRVLSVGVYVDKVSIIRRNGFEAPKLEFDVRDVYEYILNDDTILKNCGTLYINFIGYLWNLYDDITDDDWCAFRLKFLNSDIDEKHRLYGITHILLQASNFYTRTIGNEYDEELKIIDNALTKYRHMGYRGISIDLLCEMAVCLKYSTRHYRECDYIKTYLNTLFSGDTIIYNNDKTNDYIKDIIDNEHTNILYILLFNENRTI